MDVFISYSSQDREWKNRITRHLEQMRVAGVLKYTSWDDSNIDLGEKWDRIIENAIDEARVALLLVSSDFLTSEYIINKEIPKFLRRAEYEQLVLVPLMIRPSAWTRFDWLAKLEHFPKGSVLSGMSDYDVERNLTELVEELARLVEQSKFETGADEPSEEAPERGEIEEKALGKDAGAGGTEGFLTAIEITELIRNEFGCAPRKMELIFRTNTQHTWMIAIPDAIVCLLDDERTRTAGRMIQWREPVDPLTEVTVTEKPGKRTIGLVGIGRRQRWLATLQDFGNDPDMLKSALSDLIAVARN